MSDPVIRAAVPADAPAMARLSGQLGYPVETAAFEERLAYLAAWLENGVFVAELAGGIVGWVHVAGCVRLESSPFAEIMGLIVEESRRGQGVGARLVDACLGWAQARGWRQLRVRSNIVRADAQRFYERQGFTISKRQTVFVLPVEREHLA